MSDQKSIIRLLEADLPYLKATRLIQILLDAGAECGHK